MLWNPLECGNTMKPLEIVRILFENPVRKCRGKSLLQVYVHYPQCYFAAWFGSDIFIVGQVQDITQVKLLPSLVSRSSDICECKRE